MTILVISLGFAVACPASRVSDADVREPEFAGKFYPDSASKLKLAIEKFLQDALPVKVEKPVAMVVPHAGYIYSGQICADGFKQAAIQKYDVVVILGTNHTTPHYQKIALYPGSGFRTPLGVAPIDRDVVSALLKADPDDAVLDKSPHGSEHSVEVLVPFIQVVFPNAKIVPLVVGSPDLEICTRFGQALAKVLQNKRALIVASSDLSHYPAADDAYIVDRETLASMTRMDPARFQTTVRAQRVKSIPNVQTGACGEAPILAAMAAAGSLGATRAEVISYANSGDVSIGERSRVVGYGAVVFTAATEEKTVNRAGQSLAVVPAAASTSLNAADKKALLAFARETLSRFFLTDTVPLARGFNTALQQTRGVFVTLKQKGELRGCIGRMIGDEPLVNLTGAMTIQSAFNDSRFPPLTASELNATEIEISVLTPMKEVAGAADIVVGRDGVLLSKGGYSAVFLPQVATEQGWNREEMLDHLCRKAGLEAGSWKEGARLLTFQAVVFSESEFK